VPYPQDGHQRVAIVGYGTLSDVPKARGNNAAIQPHARVVQIDQEDDQYRIGDQKAGKVPRDFA
jgi:hypothetical protein